MPVIIGRSLAELYFFIIKNEVTGRARYINAVMQYPKMVLSEKTISFPFIALFYNGKSLFERTCRDNTYIIVLWVYS